MSARLIVSLSNITDAMLPGCVALAAELDTRGVPLSLLVNARPGTAGAIRPGSAAARWVRERAGMRDAVVLQGDDPPGFGRHADFAGLRRHEARLRLVAAIRGLGGLRLSSDGFCPPRWLSSAGTRLALRELGFRVCADSTGVHRLGTGELLAGRVLALRPGDAGHGWWSRAFIGSADRAARRGGLVRIAVHAAELARPGYAAAVLDSVTTALRHRAVAVTYPELGTSRLAASA